MAYELSAMHPFPTGHPRVMASPFQNFPHIRIVIDCTEVYTKRPSGLEAQKQLFSSYHNTVKFLLGISLSGAVLFVSRAWGGRASNKKITLKSGLLQQLSPGQDVMHMADRSLTLSDDLKSNGKSLIIPAFLSKDRT